ncbi:MAG: hypothetical protein R3B95_19670 [Nitrospirales bacterium]|nr:hyaluronidase [Nitrospirales bacterium]
MKLSKVSFCTASLAIWLVFMGSNGRAQAPSSPETFVVFDATLYSNKPDLSYTGIQPITLIYAGSFGPDWHKDSDRLPNLQLVQTAARKAQLKGRLAVLDIEHWPLRGPQEVVRASLLKYLSVLAWFQEAAPGLSVGYYGVPPLRDYWRAIKDPRSEERTSWLVENDQLEPLADSVDVFYPSLYTFYDDQAGWKKYAIAQMEEARRYGHGKPVYVFLWPEYHDSNKNLSGQYLAEDFWLLQLETAKQHADGIVIWGGWIHKKGKRAQWDEDAPWWIITKQFMNNINQSVPRLQIPPSSPKSLTVR